METLGFLLCIFRQILSPSARVLTQTLVKKVPHSVEPLDLTPVTSYDMFHALYVAPVPTPP